MFILRIRDTVLAYDISFIGISRVDIFRNNCHSGVPYFFWIYFSNFELILNWNKIEQSNAKIKRIIFCMIFCDRFLLNHHEPFRKLNSSFFFSISRQSGIDSRSHSYLKIHAPKFTTPSSVQAWLWAARKTGSHVSQWVTPRHVLWKSIYLFSNYVGDT